LRCWHWMIYMNKGRTTRAIASPSLYHEEQLAVKPSSLLFHYPVMISTHTHTTTSRAIKMFFQEYQGKMPATRTRSPLHQVCVGNSSRFIPRVPSFGRKVGWFSKKHCLCFETKFRLNDSTDVFLCVRHALLACSLRLTSVTWSLKRRVSVVDEMSRLAPCLLQMAARMISPLHLFSWHETWK
jgi:hypothetical protein